MSSKRKRWIYYAKGFLSLIPVGIVYYFWPQFFIPCFAFFLGFLWNYTIDTPGVAERVRSRRYRFSFLRIIVKIDQWTIIFFRKVTSKRLVISILRTLIPPLPFFILYAFTYVMNPWWIWLGACYYLVWERGLKFLALAIKLRK